MDSRQNGPTRRDAMGFVGQFSLGAASGRTGARQLTVFVFVLGGLLGSACSIEQRVSGPVALTGEWKTIDPPEPLRVGGKLEQSLCLQVGMTRDMDLHNGVVLAGGERYVLEGEALDSEQTSYVLKVAMRGGDTVCLSRAGDYPPGPDFPAEQTIVRLRLRSEPPLQVGKIWWLSSDPH